MAAQEKNQALIQQSKGLAHVPTGEEYEKMISGMLYVHLLLSLPQGVPGWR